MPGFSESSVIILWHFQCRNGNKNTMKERMINIPTEKMCGQLITDMGMFDHIVAHSRQVCRVSLFISDHLAVDSLDRELIKAAALLHDITKTRSFETHENHAETGAKLLEDMGYPEVADIIAQHVRLHDDEMNSSTPTNAQIVNYSDKRVLHDQIVPLNDRMGYILERYGSSRERQRNIFILWDKTRQLEEMIFAKLSFAPGDLGSLIYAKGFSWKEHDVLPKL
jgi:uncharacterized protein